MTASDHADQPSDQGVQHELNATCPECCGEIRTDASETVCADCGLVLDDQRIDTGPEWRGFDYHDERERTGHRLRRRGTIEAIAAGCVYGACRCNGLPRTLEEVAVVAAVDADGVVVGYSVLNRELGLPAKPMRPSAYEPRFASDLNVPDRIRSRALELSEAAALLGLEMGVQPTGFAVACLYTAAREHAYPPTQGNSPRRPGRRQRRFVPNGTRWLAAISIAVEGGVTWSSRNQ